MSNIRLHILSKETFHLIQQDTRRIFALSGAVLAQGNLTESGQMQAHLTACVPALMKPA